MKEENALTTEPETDLPAGAPAPTEEQPAVHTEGPVLGKFKSVDALVNAYSALEAEFTRRSQRLKELEAAPHGNGEKQLGSEELYRAASENEEVRTRILKDGLSSFRGVPLMTGGGAAVAVPADRHKSIAEAGALALGYLRNSSNK